MPTPKLFTVEAALWRDRVNGNTYHAARITRHTDGAELHCQFQYGYGQQYRHTALEAMTRAGWIDGDPWRYERENNYPILWIETTATKRETERLGNPA